MDEKEELLNLLTKVRFHEARAKEAILNMEDALKNGDGETLAQNYKVARGALNTAHVTFISGVDLQLKKIGVIR